MRVALLVLGLAVMLVGPDHARAQSIDLLRQGVVKVVPQGGNQARTAATGFIVRAEARAIFIVTASHVIEGADRVGIEFFNERRLYPARVLGMEGGDPRGLATLIVEEDVPADVRVLGINRDVDVRAGEAVTMIGFPASVGAPWAVTKGSIVGRRGKDIVFAGAVEEGNSGGPLIKDDQVVGLITQAQGQFAFATPSLIVQYALESWGVRFGVRLRSMPTALHMNEVLPLLKDKGFNHPNERVTIWGGDGLELAPLFGRFRHEFESRTLNGIRMVVDRATGLMWQQTSLEWQRGTVASAAVIDQINSRGYGGFTDWRLPTIEELASLIEIRATLRKLDDARFLDDALDYGICPSGDRVVLPPDEVTRIGVDFREGKVFIRMPPDHIEVSVCAVRSMTSDEMRPSLVTLPRSK